MADVPVIIGIGDVKNRSAAIADAKEPATLMLEAIQLAINDASSSSSINLKSAIDSIDVVRTWTWPYPDLPGLLAEKLGVEKSIKWKRYSEHGGDKPGKLFDEAAKRIAKGECKVAVVTGGEALASLSACAAAKKLPPPGWTKPSQAVDSVFSPTGHDLGNSSISSLWQALSSTHAATDVGAVHQIGAPIHVYPLYENAFRAHRGQSIQANHDESAKLYAAFSKVAHDNEFAWNHGRHHDETAIGTIGPQNRMICYPYPLLMNAFNTVNLASALVLTSTRTARALSIPASKWIYPLAGAGTAVSPEFWLRPNFHSAPSLSLSIDAALARAHTTVADLDLIDVYSCFPIVPKLAGSHMGLPIAGGGGGGKSLTVLGGLTSFGGAGNNYSMHALTEVARRMRAGKGKKAMVLCNGGVLTYHHVLVLGTQPPRNEAYPLDEPLPPVMRHVGAPRMADEAVGEAVVETYTVEFKRDGTPLRGYIVGRVKNGERFLANHGDEETLKMMAAGDKEIVGRSGWVWQDEEKKGRGLFAFDRPFKL
ncbi:hypothetical protein ACEQ8H_008997 [Pleosporales sp. CAS-2024a]